MMIAGLKLTICVLYGPNMDEPDLFDYLTIELLDWAADLIVMGDFNCIMDYRIDTTNRQPYVRMVKARASIKELMQIHCIDDAWKTLFPDTPGFTNYSSPHK